ncbi:ATP-binding protein [Streptomyces sp. NPDC059949]|uniref:ATP-binding protein n=1 Tax=Streptomyces sp. NPDC059949 TaxID=3347013 RepID=UPI003657F391
MSEQATKAVPGTATRRHRAHAGDGPALAPAFTGSALTGAAVAGGWLLDSFEVMPASLGIATAVATAGCTLWWAGARSLRARRSLPRIVQVHQERDAALQALGEVITAAGRGRDHVRWAAEQAAQGAAHIDFPPPAASSPSGNVCADAVGLLDEAFDEAWRTVMLVATRQHQQLNAQAELAEIFKSISPRLLSLVNRSISVISDVERDIEDPELMAELFRVDHLLTQIRRAVESLAVLGGNTPPRDSAPVMLAAAIRRAVAEIPQYQRVRVARSPYTAAALPGYASPNVVHLLAALMENATGYSTDRVEVHVHEAGEGIAIELLDRGAGMSQQKRESLNRLLAAPESEDPRARLREGRIGLLVAALLAKRHRITIQLGPNIVGGTQAVVIIPRELLVSPGQQHAPRPAASVHPAAHGPAGPVRREHTGPSSADATALPQRIRPAPPGESTPEASPRQNGGRPQLPRRGEAERRVPPVAQQAPGGRATSALMANFRSRRPSQVPPGSQPPAV